MKEIQYDTMGSLLPSDKELKYMRRQFIQSAKMQGRIGKFFQVRDYKVVGTDKEFIYEDVVMVPYHLNEYPSRKLLTRYGWFSENMEDLPILLTLTYSDLDNKIIKVDEGAQIEISGKISVESPLRETLRFQVTELKTDFELNQAVCKVVPVREEQKENVKVIATADDPTLENVYINRKIYYTQPDLNREED